MGKQELKATPVVLKTKETGKNKNDKKLKKGKKQNKILIVLIIIILLCGVGIGIYKCFYSNNKKSVIEVKVLDSLKNYGYTLSDKDTELFKNEYKILKKILKEKEINNEAYATQVAKLFIIDLYTMDTKVNKLDVGGSEYFYSDKVSMFETKVMDTVYYHLSDNTYGDREQELPEVSSIEVLSFEDTTYKIDQKEKDAYLVKLKWSYVKDMGYDQEASVVLCQEDGVRISVVDFQPTLEPEYEEK